MEQEQVNIIMHRMANILDNMQLAQFKRVLDELSNGVFEDIDSKDILQRFIDTKKLEGCSPKTLIQYRRAIEKLINDINKNIRTVITDELREYLTNYYPNSNCSKVSIDNMRRIFSSFFNWLEDENYILKSPGRRIHKIKSMAPVKEVYSDDEMELLRDNCANIRDLALIDLLASTGMRIGELVRLNRDDIDFYERECVVLGKGDKERIVYFDVRTKLHLQEYLNSRHDDNAALFVSLRSPHTRLTINGIEFLVRRLGRSVGIKKCHPHKFRRTMATMAIDKGMPIEQVQKLLGHEKIDTTLHYAMVKQSNVKNAHRKYIG
ncbi:site-specific tyrosine recombinase/integron integrase [Anaerovibrio sp.]|uniref:site-specific tyrosine recombinase/integron integrase n=1 Tax=Anaerovibrio sp. TaxID=1872532 RepID=UPI002606A70C|nr:site-specific tyrosine recombinase/integron integrase [Anaerovibrio sp.]MDD6597998.1 tyrosine-type recombinase/integrase [Anaerovibrio sp.]